MPIIDTYGLIGYPLGHSFSKRYFSEKFVREQIMNAQYELYPIPDIDALPGLIQNEPTIRGLNVTIPYKNAVIPFLHELDETAAAVGAVNCISISQNGFMKGFNTDAIGFRKSLEGTAGGRWAGAATKAIVLGDGGAAKAVIWVLEQLGMTPWVVSRKSTDMARNLISWAFLENLLVSLNDENPLAPTLIVNTTPVGMSPNESECPDLPFHLLGTEHLVFDLIYNPLETVLLQRAQQQGCTTQNGLEMLYLQADAAWKIWRNTSES